MYRSFQNVLALRPVEKGRQLNLRSAVVVKPELPAGAGEGRLRQGGLAVNQHAVPPQEVTEALHADVRIRDGIGAANQRGGITCQTAETAVQTAELLARLGEARALDSQHH